MKKLPECISVEHPEVTCWGHNRRRELWCDNCKTLSVQQEICALISDDYDLFNSGGLHIVVEDGNTEHHHVQWCVNHIEGLSDPNPWVLHVAKLMLTVDEDELTEMYGQGWGVDYEPPTLKVMERSLGRKRSSSQPD